MQGELPNPNPTPEMLNPRNKNLQYVTKLDNRDPAMNLMESYRVQNSERESRVTESQGFGLFGLEFKV